ncbi:MAG TPA: iron ABC transporter permease [Candidatus Acidoferrales bacterium]|nr:iron ABC transporter permease [Candidatus Acidoferrales bacterium]
MQSILSHSLVRSWQRIVARRAGLDLPFFAMTLVTALVSFLILFPMAMLLYGSFWSERPGFPGHFTVQNYVTAYSDFETYQMLFNTALMIGTKTLIAGSIALLLAWIIARTDTPCRGLLETLIVIPFFVPGILEAVGWIMLLSPKTGTLNLLFKNLFGLKEPLLNIYSLGGIIWVMSLGSVSFLFLFFVTALRSMDASLEEAAALAGAGPVRTALTITLPMIAPVILGASMFSFIRTMDAFEVPVLLGLPAGVFVFGNRIYAAIEYDFPVNYGLATALGGSLLVLMMGLLAVQNKLLRGKEFFVITGKGYRPHVVSLGPFKYVALAVCLGYFLLATGLPLSQVVIGSFLRVFGLMQWDMLTLDNYKTVGSDPTLWRGLKNTILVGGGAAMLTILLCSVVSYITVRTKYRGRKLLDLICWLPNAIPGIVAGVGMLWAYITLPFPLYGTLTLLVIVFVTIGLPVGVRLMSGVMVQLSPELEECSMAHGASWATTFRKIVLPLLKPALAAGVLILFVNFSRAVSTTLLFAQHGTELLAVALFRYSQSGTRLGTISALAVILTMINVTAMLIARRLGAFGRQAG